MCSLPFKYLFFFLNSERSVEYKGQQCIYVQQRGSIPTLPLFTADLAFPHYPLGHKNFSLEDKAAIPQKEKLVNLSFCLII